MIHSGLDPNHWYSFSLASQLANVGAEVGRAINWKNKKQKDYSEKAFHRALELLYLTVDDPKNHQYPTLKELLRVQEILVDYFAGENIYQSSDDFLNKYFLAFNYLARNTK